MARRARGFWTEQRGKLGIWRLRWTENRRKRTRSLSTADEAAADQWFDRFIAELDQPPRPETPTVSSIVDGYLAGGEGIVTDYARAELTARHIKAKLGWLEADALRPSHSATYARQRREEGIGGGTIRRELTTLRAALRWAQGERLIAAAPSVRLPPRPAPRDRWLTRDEADRLLGSCVSHHVQLFVLVALHTAAGAIRLWLLAPRLRGYAGLVVAAVGDAGARDVMFTTKDAYHAVIEPNGLAGQVLAAAKGGTA